jgi:hypothetical protein
MNSEVLGLEKREYIFPSISSAKRLRPCSAVSNVKLEVRYSGVECSRFDVLAVWVRMFLVSLWFM